MHCRPVCGYAMVFFWDVDKWGSDTPFLRTVRLATILNVWEHIHTWLADSLRATTHEFWDFFLSHSKYASLVCPAIQLRLDYLHEADWSAPCCPSLRSTDCSPKCPPEGDTVRATSFPPKAALVLSGLILPLSSQTPFLSLSNKLVSFFFQRLSVVLPSHWQLSEWHFLHKQEE